MFTTILCNTQHVYTLEGRHREISRFNYNATKYTFRFCCLEKLSHPNNTQHTHDTIRSSHPTIVPLAILSRLQAYSALLGKAVEAGGAGYCVVHVESTRARDGYVKGRETVTKLPSTRWLHAHPGSVVRLVFLFHIVPCINVFFCKNRWSSKCQVSRSSR